MSTKIDVFVSKYEFDQLTFIDTKLLIFKAKASTKDGS